MLFSRTTHAQQKAQEQDQKHHLDLSRQNLYPGSVLWKVCSSWNQSAPFSDTCYEGFLVNARTAAFLPRDLSSEVFLACSHGKQEDMAKEIKKTRSNLIKTTFSIAGTISLGNQCYLTPLWSRIPQDTWKVLDLRWMCIYLCTDTHISKGILSHSKIFACKIKPSATLFVPQRYSTLISWIQPSA